jgi:hypothetical protein
MNVQPEEILAIATIVVALTQFIKTVLPGDWDDYGPAIAGLASVLGVLAWTMQNAPVALRAHPFDLLVLLAGVHAAATGGYTLARKATNVGGRQVKKLREAREARAEGAA